MNKLLPVIATIITAALTENLSASDAQFVVDGEARDVRFVGRDWATDKGSLVGAGTGNMLSAGYRFGPGDFRVQVRLSIERLSTSAASLVVNESHLGFEGKQQEMFTEGVLFGRHNLGKPIVKEGEPFDLALARTGNRLHIAIDGRQVVSTKVDDQQTVSVGLRPWRSTMRVRQFVGTGNLVAAPKPVPHTAVFASGMGGYHTYRIPAIAVTKAGTLLAFCEGRKSGRGDAGNIDMLVSRSTDRGRTWSEPIVVWDDGANTCGNPAPVVDHATGTIWLPMTWNLGSDHEREIMAGTSQDARHVYVTHSKDDGKTWAQPKKISASTRKSHWRWYATGPGNAIQLTRGPHRGRLLIPANHSDHSDAKKHPYRSHVFWSDDHGKTWQLGGVHEEKTNESAVVERSDGSVLQAMRSYHGTNRRALSVSGDGGSTWSPVELHDALDTPVCQANIMRYSWADEAKLGNKNRILFSSPRGGSRSRLTVWLSYDDGKTWPVSKLIYAGGAAYSNLVRLPDDRVGVLYERDGYKTISLATFEIGWLESNE